MHALNPKNKRAICGALVTKMSNSSFDVDADDACVTCSRRVRKWKEPSDTL